MEKYKLHCGDCLEVLKQMDDSSVDSCVTDPPAGIAFMGKKWDSDKGGRDQWVAWLSSVFVEVRRVLKPGGHCLVWALPRTSHWTATALEDAGFEIRDKIYHAFGTGFPKSLDVSKAIDRELGAERKKVRHAPRGKNCGTFSGAPDARPWIEASKQNGFHESAGNEPVTAEAAAWQGWKTCLKPAVEEWVLCRKPLEGTVAQNVLCHGCGALNVDGCRIPVTEAEVEAAAVPNRKGVKYCKGDGVGRSVGTHDMSAGRYPANLICSDPAVLGDKTRLFYCPKASKAERNAGLETLPKKSPKRYGKMSGCPDHGAKYDAPEANHHPTCKPVELMVYLCRLITPADGVVLDPFMGSGSTGLAAIREGFQFVGIEAEQEYVRIAGARINGQSKA